MTYTTDSHYLSSQQYSDARNLNVRIRFHQRFSTNPYPVHRWFFDHVHLEGESRILELGAGPGRFWADGMPAPPAGWQVVLSDFSPGMVQAARYTLAASDHPFRFAVVDAQAISFSNACFDAVIANNMLYHVPDRESALAEIRRVLRASGALYAMTFGWDHLLELRRWVSRFGLATTLLPPKRVAGAFDLEQGQDELSRWFAHVQVTHYPDALLVTEAAPLLDYVRSTAGPSPFSEDEWQAFATFLEEKIAARGSVRIKKA